MTAGREKTIARVAKLLALANSSNAGEAAAAAAAAQRLLSEHRLSEAEVAAGAAQEPIVLRGLFRTRGGDKWKRYLASICGSANGCRVVKMDRDGAIVVVGTQGDVLLVEALFVGLVRDLTVASRASPEPRSWLIGAACGVREAVDAAQKEAFEQASSVALVHIRSTDARIEEVLAGCGMRAARTRKITVSQAAFESGRVYGKSMNLSSKRSIGENEEKSS
jgi:hypothetical protein